VPPSGERAERGAELLRRHLAEPGIAGGLLDAACRDVAVVERGARSRPEYELVVELARVDVVAAFASELGGPLLEQRHELGLDRRRDRHDAAAGVRLQPLNALGTAFLARRLPLSAHVHVAGDEVDVAPPEPERLGEPEPVTPEVAGSSPVAPVENVL
jgi:hypothetical protein